MKVKGREFKNPHEVTVVIPRGDEPVAFKFRAVLDYTAFEKLCPEPQPPFIRRPGQGEGIRNVHDPEFLKKQSEYVKKKTAWMFLESISATEDLEWETVKKEDSNTWNLWSKELTDNKFSDAEMQRMFKGFLQANSLDEAYVEEARRSFFLAEALRNVSSSQREELTSMQSGEPANDSV